MSPARVRRAEFPTGSLVELHENIVEPYEEVEITFSENEEDPTQRMQRRSSVPQAPNPFARRAPRELRDVVAEAQRRSEYPVRESVVLSKEPREPFPTLIQDEDEEEESYESAERYARIPEPPQPEPMSEDTPTNSQSPILPAVRVAIYVAKDGTPQLAMHREGDPVGAPTAVLVPDCRDDALRIMQIFRRAEAQD